MPTVKATLNNHIWLPWDDIPGPAIQDLMQALTIPNEEKISAKKNGRYGWTEMPDDIELWDEHNGQLVIPRGFRDPFERGLAEYGTRVEWDDQRTNTFRFRLLEPFPLRPQQGPAAAAILEAQDGIYESPAGSGKTVAALEVIRRACQRWNLVVVHQIDIAEQWKREAAQFLPGLRVGIIGEGRWEEAELTVATVQTLYAQMERLDREGWWRKWGLACLDECHHQTAMTFEQIVARIWALYRFGLSATPDKTGIFEIAQSVLGDVIHVTTRHELRDHGILARPRVEVVETNFDFHYWGNHTALKWEDCQVPGCRKSGNVRHSHRSNYSKLLQALVRDDGRNQLIAQRAIAEYRAGKRVLIDSAQVNHLREIAKWIHIYDEDAEVLWMTGSHDSGHREFIKRTLDAEPAILLSTIAREAVNIPRLDTVHLAFPIKNPGTIRQIVGRVERAIADKGEPIVNDYADLLIGVLANQFKKRRWEVYAEERYRVIRGGKEEDDGNEDT